MVTSESQMFHTCTESLFVSTVYADTLLILLLSGFHCSDCTCINSSCATCIVFVNNEIIYLFSLRTLYRKCEEMDPVIFLIKSSDNAVEYTI